MGQLRPTGPVPDEMLRLCELALHQAPPVKHGDPQSVRPLPGLRVVRYPVRTDFEATIYEPVICLILRGRKETTFGGRTLSMGAGECVLVSHDLPVVSRVVEVPYLALLLDVEIDTLRGLYDELGASPRDRGESCALEVHAATWRLLDALGRYLALTRSQTDAKVLGPMISKEIHYRLLMDPVGGMLRSLISSPRQPSGSATRV